MRSILIKAGDHHEQDHKNLKIFQVWALQNKRVVRLWVRVNMVYMVSPTIDFHPRLGTHTTHKLIS